MGDPHAGIWESAFVCAVAVIAVSVAWLALECARRRRKGLRRLSLARVVPAVVFVVSVILCFPWRWATFSYEAGWALEALWVAIRSTLALFATSSDYVAAMGMALGLGAWFGGAYARLLAVIGMLAPVSAVGLVLSFLRGFMASVRYLLAYRRPVIAFSRLSPESLALMESTRRAALEGRDQSGMPMPAFVFAGASGGDAKEVPDLVARANAAGCICFDDGLLDPEVGIWRHSLKAPLAVVVTGGDAIDPSAAAAEVIAAFDGAHEPSGPRWAPAHRLARRSAHNSLLYVIDDDGSSRLLLDGTHVRAATGSAENAAPAPAGASSPLANVSPLYAGQSLTVRRMEWPRQFVHRLLWEDRPHGNADAAPLWRRLFEGAEPRADGTRRVTVLLAGLGRVGSTMLRTLPWFCQMSGYYLDLWAFDADADAERRLRAVHPGLLGGADDPRDIGPAAAEEQGQCGYALHVVAGEDALGAGIDDVLALMRSDAPPGEPPATLTLGFVALGDDERSLDAAVRLRVALERQGQRGMPIYAVVHDDGLAARARDAARSAAKHAGQPATGRPTITSNLAAYDVTLVGGLGEVFSYEALLDRTLERAALDYSDRKREERARRGETPAETAEERALRHDRFWCYEYYRNSTVAEAMHAKVVAAYGPRAGLAHAEPDADELRRVEEVERKTEHRRWEAYLYSEGWVFGTPRNDLARQHDLLVPTNELPKAERLKDLRMGMPNGD